MFLGGAAGSAAATLAWNGGGWTAVAGLGVTFSALAVLIQIAGPKRTG
jgi:hypothetical protein